MKYLFITVSFIILNMATILPADSTKVNNIHYKEVPFEVEGNRHLLIPNNILPSHLQGSAVAAVIISKNGKLLNFAIIKIDVSDSSRANILRYFDKEAFSLLSKNESEIFSNDYYPSYIRGFYNEIKKAILRLTFRKKGNIPLEEANTFSIMFSIN